MLWHQLQPFFLPFVLGGTLLGIMAALLAYPVVLIGLRRYRENQRRVTGSLAGSFRDETK